jgi:Kef-type K+ transport system membrane component KefB
MAAKRLRNSIISIVASFAMLFGIGFLNPVYSAPYGACTYSSGTFDQNSTCDQSSSSESLSDTGDNQGRLIAIAGLILGISGIALMAYLIISSRRKKHLAQ